MPSVAEPGGSDVLRWVVVGARHRITRRAIASCRMTRFAHRSEGVS